METGNTPRLEDLFKHMLAFCFVEGLEGVGARGFCLEIFTGRIRDINFFRATLT